MVVDLKTSEIGCSNRIHFMDIKVGVYERPQPVQAARKRRTEWDSNANRRGGFAP